MLKKNIKVVKGVLNSRKDQMAKVGFVDGNYYACDGFRLVRFAEYVELPMFGNSEKHPNYLFMMREAANTTDWETIFIPYTVQQIKDWFKKPNSTAFIYDENKKKITRNKAFYVGKTVEMAYSHKVMNVEINPKFLIDAMETTGSNEIKVDSKGKILVEGNGFTWLIMPILQDVDDIDHNGKMTEIPIEFTWSNHYITEAK